MFYMWGKLGNGEEETYFNIAVRWWVMFVLLLDIEKKVFSRYYTLSNLLYLAMADFARDFSSIIVSLFWFVGSYDYERYRFGDFPGLLYYSQGTSPNRSEVNAPRTHPRYQPRGQKTRPNGEVSALETFYPFVLI